MAPAWGEMEGKEEVNVLGKESEFSQALQRAHTCGESCEVWCSALGAQGLGASASLHRQAILAGSCAL